MKKDPREIIKLIHVDYHVNKLFNEFSSKAAFILARIKGNEKEYKKLLPFVKTQLNQVLKDFSTKYEHLLRTISLKAFEKSEKETDEMFHKYIKGAGATLAGKQLLDIFNRQANPETVITIENILDLKRNNSIYKKYMEKYFNLSDRIWKLSQENIELIKMYLESGISNGQSADVISRDLRQFLKEPNMRFRRIRDKDTGRLKLSQPAKNYHPGQGVYRSSYKNALRVAREEVNRAYRLADMYRYEKTEFILGYEVKLSGSHPKEDICDSLFGKYPKSFVFSGWHVQCFCYIVPILPSQDQFIKYLNTGQIKKATIMTRPPLRATRFIDENKDKILAWKNKPYWLQDNFKVTKDSIKLNI